MAFCLAGALSFNLASPESADNRPVFAQLMLDEAFSKSDPQFAQQALSAFRKFGFQLVIVATVQNATTIQPYIDSVVMVSKTEPTGRNARPARLWRPGRSPSSRRSGGRCARPRTGCQRESEIRSSTWPRHDGATPTRPRDR